MPKTHFILCDDNADDLETLCGSIDEYVASRGIFGETRCFSSSEELLKFSEEMSDGKAVYLLDVVTPAVDGIELGKAL